MSEHPEVENTNSLEPTIGEQLRYEDLKRGIDRLDDLGELRELAKLLAKQAMLIQPASIRYLAKEAARNLANAPADKWLEMAETLKDHLTQQ